MLNQATRFVHDWKEWVGPCLLPLWCRLLHGAEAHCGNPIYICSGRCGNRSRKGGLRTICSGTADFRVYYRIGRSGRRISWRSSWNRGFYRFARLFRKQSFHRQCSCNLCRSLVGTCLGGQLFSRSIGLNMNSCMSYHWRRRRGHIYWNTCSRRGSDQHELFFAWHSSSDRKSYRSHHFDRKFRIWSSDIFTRSYYLCRICLPIWERRLHIPASTCFCRFCCHFRIQI